MPPISLDAFLKSISPPEITELPLVHSSPAGLATDILHHNTIRANRCRWHDIQAVYTYYGKPAYDTTARRTGLAGKDLLPVCFILKPYTVAAPITHVYPFDSGGYYDGRYSPHIGPGLAQAYQLTPLIETARRVVVALFGTNENYYRGTLSIHTSLRCPDDPFNSLIALNEAEIPDATYDDRSSSIEVILGDNISLKKSVHTIVLPACLWNQRWVRILIHETLQVPASIYPSFRGLHTGYSALLRERIEQILTDGGFLTYGR